MVLLFSSVIVPGWQHSSQRILVHWRHRASHLRAWLTLFSGLKRNWVNSKVLEFSLFCLISRPVSNKNRQSPEPDGFVDQKLPFWFPQVSSLAPLCSWSPLRWGLGRTWKPLLPRLRQVWPHPPLPPPPLSPGHPLWPRPGSRNRGIKPPRLRRSLGLCRKTSVIWTIRDSDNWTLENFIVTRKLRLLRPTCLEKRWIALMLRRGRGIGGVGALAGEPACQPSQWPDLKYCHLIDSWFMDWRLRNNNEGTHRRLCSALC